MGRLAWSSTFSFVRFLELGRAPTQGCRRVNRMLKAMALRSPSIFLQLLSARLATRPAPDSDRMHRRRSLATASADTMVETAEKDSEDLEPVQSLSCRFAPPERGEGLRCSPITHWAVSCNSRTKLVERACVLQGGLKCMVVGEACSGADASVTAF